MLSFWRLENDLNLYKYVLGSDSIADGTKH